MAASAAILRSMPSRWPPARRRTSALARSPYNFCSERCRTRFEADPSRYLGERATPEPMPAGTIYTCPMHPEIVGVVDGQAVAFGNARLMADLGVDPGLHQETADARRDAGETVMFVVADGAVAGLRSVPLDAQAAD